MTTLYSFKVKKCLGYRNRFEISLLANLDPALLCQVNELNSIQKVSIKVDISLKLSSRQNRY